ncbi:MAG: YdeI/OmpD-associated family protein [Sphingosinicella sp.]|nr:YdeI/OmpD-associated family protein [Sphingosinicella sp.]
MAPVKVDPTKIHEFIDAGAFCQWLAEHYASEDEVWIKIHKLASGLPSITPKEAIDVSLCWGWIDAIRKGLDDTSYLQRYTPRRKKSIWSKINVDNVARLIEEGRMTEAGLKQVRAAQADGRWERAYDGGKDMKIPPDLQAAIDAEPEAKAMLERLSAQNRYALAFRTHNMKTEAGRTRKIEQFVEMLKKGETVHPQRGAGGSKPDPR